MITLENICKSFGEKAVLRNFSFNFECGKMYAISGESGSGKTTLLNIIAKILQPDSGKIETCPGKKLRMVFQENRLLNSKNVLQNAALRSENEAYAKQLLSKFGLENELYMLPKKLSGGMKRRVAIVRALAERPDILLLDEPFNGLDEKMRDLVFAEIKKVMKNGTTLLVMHDNAFIEQNVDEILKLNEQAK